MYISSHNLINMYNNLDKQNRYFTERIVNPIESNYELNETSYYSSLHSFFHQYLDILTLGIASWASFMSTHEPGDGLMKFTLGKMLIAVT